MAVDRVRPRKPTSCEAYVLPSMDLFILYSRDRDRAFTVNPSALAIWQAADGATSTRQLATDLARALDFEETDLLIADVRSAVHTMLDLELLETD